MPPKLVVVCGPTATGKTRLGVALAKRLDGEVVSADSMQLYRGMPIGTAQPTEAEREGVPHHMMGIADPAEPYSVARYVEEASACVDDILRRGKRPILVGGTGQYIDALCSGRTFSASRPESGTRARLQAVADAGGLPQLWADLQRVDPAAAAALHPNDAKRVVRALEVWYETGKPISRHNAETRTVPPRYDRATIVLNYADRAVLRARIDRRVDLMVAAGLIDEVRALLAAGVPADATALQAIGYKQLIPAVRDGGDLAAAIEEVKLRSRQYAKRQLTWFRRCEGAHWIDMEENTRFSDVVQDSTAFLTADGVG